ncbi:MAG: efflux RND transporter permease subunit [Gemmataceae bacterium]
MQRLAEICVRRPIFAAMLILALVVAGAASFWQLSTDRFPKMDLPMVTVRTTLPGAAPEEIESEITQHLENAVATVEGIQELRSISSESTSLIMLTFHLDRDVSQAAQDVRDAINAVLNRLPPRADPPVIRKLDLDDTPIMSLALAGQRDSRELYNFADKGVKSLIESAPGVGQVTIYGAEERAVRIEVDSRRLAAHNLSILQVREALARQNAEVPGGFVDAGFREMNLRTLGRYSHPRFFEDLVVKTVNNRPIRIRDLGHVVDGQKEIRSLARLNGEPAVVLQIQRQSGTNTMEVIQGIKESLPRAQALLPPDVQLTIVQDQSGYIESAMHEIQSHLIMGSILASATVLLFMRSWRSTLIASVAIPASIIATFGMMRVLGFTLNNVTMLALVLMVGVVIDDAIVVLENIYRFMEEKGLSPAQAAIEGTREIGLAVMATTFSLVIVFLPVSFLSSLAGRFLYQFGLTSAVAILVSLLVSFTLTPMMCSRMLRSGMASHGEARSRRGLYHYLDAAYTACLRWAMRHRFLVLVVVVLVVASNIPLYLLVPQDFVPTDVDESEFRISVLAPEGASLASMDKAMRAVEEEIRTVPGVTHLLTTVGSSSLSRLNSAQIHVRVVDIDDRTFSLGRLWRETLRGQPLAAWRNNFSQRQVMTEMRRRLTRFTDLRFSVRNQNYLRMGASSDIDFVMTGPDIHTLAHFSNAMRDRVAAIPGIVDLDTTLRMDKPELHVELDRARAAALGIDAQEIAVSLSVMVGGDDRVSRFRDARMDEVYDVELRLIGSDRGDMAAISQLYVRPQSSSSVGTATPPLIRLDNVVHMSERLSLPRIDRLDRQRMVAIRANVAPGYALADRLDAMHQTATEIGIPTGYRTVVLGKGRELHRTFSDFAFAFIFSIIFMYIVLAAQFEHLVHPLTILISLPLAVPFGLFSLWLGGETLNLYSALGILVLFGVVKKNSILQVDHTNQLRAAGIDRFTAIIQANRDRLRPILMTTLSFVAGMLPMAIATGPGAEERRSIAVLVLGGQSLSLLLTLLATPVIYSYFDDCGKLFARGANR